MSVLSGGSEEVDSLGRVGSLRSSLVEGAGGTDPLRGGDHGRDPVTPGVASTFKGR